MYGDALVLREVRVDEPGAPRAPCSDQELVTSWLDSKSAYSRGNFAMTTQRFLARADEVIE
jgi:hypothetical protein